ncbi:MAG: pyruvate ferredoxin oxidoreductase [Prevotella sp.]|nr:pyruvate ferredoxin oxidoreductase [Prevotella sp.]
MDYKYIEQLLERYFNAETSLEEERILRSFFSQTDIPAELEQWKALFTVADEESLGDDFDERILQMIGEEPQQPIVKARKVQLTQRLMPLFKAAAIVAIILTLGSALQAPWDNSWNHSDIDYASYQQELDSVAAVSPVRAENTHEVTVDSTKVPMASQPTN